MLLTLEFQYSRYCQNEAGFAIATGNPYLLITIPPSTNSDVGTISPILNGRQAIHAKDPREELARDEQDFVTLLKSRLADDFPIFADKPEDIQRGNAAIQKVNESLAELIDEYKLKPRRRVELEVWTSISDESPAQYSIINRIKMCLQDSQWAHLAVVGVSLKFSLELITKALQQLPVESSPDGTRPLKRLSIELVHMDDQSHILRALNDQIDIRSILDNFHAGWALTETKWRESCLKAGIELDLHEPRQIDYIPPRVGILISNSKQRTLYAGRCAFQKTGSELHLLAGEREYFYYNAKSSNGSADERADQAIREFEQYLLLYSMPGHNGVVLVGDPMAWLAQLRSSIESYQDLKTVLFISNTMSKPRSLIIPALKRGLQIKPYTRPPELLASEQDKVRVKSLMKDIRMDIRNSGACSGSVELRYYRHRQTLGPP
jgi:hypothetical protein